jgi:hypothetical protein
VHGRHLHDPWLRLVGLLGLLERRERIELGVGLLVGIERWDGDVRPAVM